MIDLDISHIDHMYISSKVLKRFWLSMNIVLIYLYQENVLAGLVTEQKVKLRLCAFDDIFSKKVIFAYKLLS